MYTIKKIALGISSFITGLFAVATAAVIFEEGLSGVSLFIFGLFAWAFIVQLKKMMNINANRDLLRDSTYEDAYRKGREMVNRAYDDKLNKMNDAEMKEAIKNSLDSNVEEEIDPQELQEMLSAKENQTSTQKAE